MKMKHKFVRCMSMLLTVLLLASVVITGFGIETLAAGIDSLKTATATAQQKKITSIELRVHALNAKATYAMEFAAAEGRAYPENGVVTFRVFMRINNEDYWSDELPSNMTLENDVTFSYKTYDISALAATGDYVPIEGTYTFKAGTRTLHHDFQVTVNPTEYGLYWASYDVRKYAARGTTDYAWNFSNYKGNEGEAPEKTAYWTRCFGFKIFDLKNCTAYKSVDKSTGANTVWDYYIGTLPVNHYYPFYYKTDKQNGYTLLNYNSAQYCFGLTVSALNDVVTTTKWYFKNCEFGQMFEKDIYQTGLGHLYIGGSGYMKGDDKSQRDSYVGLTYEGYESATGITDKNLMLQLKRGIVTIEVDGFPFPDFFDFACYRDRNAENRWHGKTLYDEMEWDEASYQFEKYRASCHGHPEGDAPAFYKVEGNPDWVGLTAERESKWGEGRYIDMGEIYLAVRDDVPVEIESYYIEDTSAVVKTQDDKLTVTLRFNEPVQVNLKTPPTLVCGLNSANTTAENAVVFNYEAGAGSDTLVFSVALSTLPDKNIEQVVIYYMTNADKVTDFSGTEEIFVTSKKDATRLVQNGIDETNDIVTKAAGTRWSVAKTYLKGNGDLTEPALIGPITLKLTEAIDTRSPEIYKITDNNKGKTAKNHTVTVELNEKMTATVYAHWTEDMNGIRDTNEIPRPSAYTDDERISLSGGASGKTYQAWAELDGTRYLWIRVETPFGKVDERLCGPFFFDTTPDSAANITVTSGALSSQTKSKTLQFTIDHTGDYLSCAGDNVFDNTKHSETAFTAENIELSELSLVYSTDASWSSGSEIESVPLYSSKLKNRLKAKVVATKEDYVYAFGFSSKNLAQDTTPQTTDMFIAKTNGVSQKVTYITKVTYEITVDQNDLGLQAGKTEYKKVYLGFKVTDASGNTKSPNSKAFVAGVDYVNNEYALFDIRDVKNAGITYDSASSALPVDKATKTVLDSTVNVFSAALPLTVTFDFDNAVSKADLASAGYEVKAHIKKSNSQIVSDPTSDTAGHPLSSWGSEVAGAAGTFVSDPIKDASTDQYTSWFSWRLAEDDGVGYGAIVLTTYTLPEANDLCGYYEVYFSFKNAKNEVIYTPSATFYLGNNENETANISSMKSGKLFVNKVFQFPEESRYYYQTADGVIQDPYYAENGGKLTFSSEAVATNYILFKERQDLYLYQIPDTETAESLNQKGGNKTRSDADITAGRTALVGQWWIRYKAKTWSPGSKENASDWIYYFYSDSATTPTIDLANLPGDLTVAMNAVVNTILSYGSSVLLTGEENLDKYGSPKIPLGCIKYDPESAQGSLCTENQLSLKYESKFSSAIYFQGDRGIYNATVAQDDENGATKEYSLASTAVLTVSGKTKVFITPYDGDYAGIWGQVPSGKNLLLKDAVNTVYRQILIAAGNSESNLGTVSAPSGRYTVFEFDENGYATYTVYIDRTAPQINFNYTVYTDDGGKEQSAKHYTRGNEAGLVIHGVSFTLTGIGYYGAANSYEDEIDPYAYVVVYDSARTRTLYAMTVADLRSATNVTLDDEGTYYVEVWDRSGNTYTFTVVLVERAMTVAVKAEENGFNVKVQYRDESQISVYEVKRDGVTIDTKFAKSKTFTENGLYTVRIVDRFGIEYNSPSVKYSREIPTVTWRSNSDDRPVGNGTASATSVETTPSAKIVGVDSVTYNVVTSVPLSFRFPTAAGIKVEFLGSTEEDEFWIVPGQYTTYTQKELRDCQVKCSYTAHPNVYVVYNVIVDTVAPVIDVEYDHYSFESRTQLDTMLQLLENESDYVGGETITPTRIDFSLLNATTLRISSGASVFATEARLTLNDNSGISKFKLELNGETLYEGAYHEDGVYRVKKGVEAEDGELVNVNSLTEYGKYTITAVDALGNKSTFTFTNTTSNAVVYTVDGKVYEPYYDYVYETDADGRIILDLSGEPILKEKWYFLEKFETDDGQTAEDIYFDTSTEESLGHFFRFDQEYTYRQYGNETQSVNLCRNSDVQILLTYEDQIRVEEEGVEKLKTVTCYRFVGLKVKDDGIYLYQYVVDKAVSEVYEVYTEADEKANLIPEGASRGDYKTDADGNRILVSRTTELSTDEDLTDTPVFSMREAVLGQAKTIYLFDSAIESGYSKIGVTVSATYEKNGTLTLTVGAPSDSSLIVTSEIKVTQSEGSFEPSYYKTLLSHYESSVEIANDKGVIEIREEEMGVAQWKYANGEHLTVNVDDLKDPYLTAVLISYSKTMTAGDYLYLYATDPEIPTAAFLGEGDGYYFIKTVNLFGNEKEYRLAISNSLLVSTVAEYLDGWQRQYPTGDTSDINANKAVTVSFRDDEQITYSVKKNGLAVIPDAEVKNGSVTMVFDTPGSYELTVKDQFGNVVVRKITVQEKTLSLPTYILLNPQTKALRYSENYTNMKVSINASLLSSYDIQYIAIEKEGGKTYVLLDRISADTEKAEPQEGDYASCIGLLGDGTYTVVFRDKYGNRAESTVHYRETETLSLTRMTSSSEKAEAFSIADAQNAEINFISNNALFFNTAASQYVFTVDGQKEDCPFSLSFANKEVKGRISYDIEYVDEYGFSYQFRAVLYRTDIQLELDSSVSSVKVNGALLTTDNIRVVYSEGATCYYQQGESDYIEFPADGILKKDGSYVIFAKDIAGNNSYFTITKDSVVEYSFREGKYGKAIKQGMVTNSDSVLFRAENGDSAEIKAAFLNGQKIETEDYSFTKNGKWDVLVADQAGNQKLFTFYVYTHEINRLDFYEPEDYSFTDIWFVAEGAGSAVSMNSSIKTEDNGKAHVVFEHAGTYTVTLNSDIDGTAVNFTLEISEAMPTAVLNGVEDGGSTIETISISGTKKYDTVYVYQNGSDTPISVYEIAYDGEKVEISDEGEYVVVIKNRAENAVSYTFTRKHVANTAGSVLIILLMVAIVIGLFAGMTYRNKSRVDR